MLAGTHVAKIAAGEAHFCAQVAQGEPTTAPPGIYCWGYNSEGQFGNGSTSSSSVPVLAIGRAPITTWQPAATIPAALAYSGGAYCWGDNEFGQVGDGSITQRTSPAKVMGLEENVVEMKVGLRHACAVLANGTVKCWGTNSSGEVGRPVYREQLTPVNVLDGPTPQIEVNYPDGKTGSVFTVTGWNFPPGVPTAIGYSVVVSSSQARAALQVNPTDTIPTSEDGSFIFFLTTTGVKPGTYQVTVGGATGASASFTLAPGEVKPMSRRAVGLRFALPTDLLPPADTGWHIYLPLTLTAHS